MEFAKLFAYDEWANGQALETALGNAKAIRLMSHIVAAQVLWLERMERRPQSTPVWPEWDADECRARMGTTAVAIAKFAAAADLDAQFSYTTSKGDLFTTRVEDALMHVVMHGVYHRGQVAAAVRAAGGEPAYTDFVQAVRTGKLPL